MGEASLSTSSLRCWGRPSGLLVCYVTSLQALLGFTDRIYQSVGGYISQNTTWRWCFWTIVLVNGAVQVVAFFFLRETYAPRLLQLKARALRARTGNPKLRTKWEQSDADRTLLGLLRTTLRRPWVMLGTQPIVQLFALYQAFNFGTLYLFISSFPALWEGRYGMPKGDATLNYISLAAGSLIGVYICAPATDSVYARLKRRNGLADEDPGFPEFRVPLMVPASIATPCGIFLYAWAAEAKAHFLVPNVSRASVHISNPDTNMSTTARRRHICRKLHCYVPVHVGLHRGRVQSSLGLGVGSMRFPPIPPRLRLSAICPGSLWHPGLRLGRQRAGYCRRRHRHPRAVGHLVLRQQAEGCEQVCLCWSCFESIIIIGKGVICLGFGI